MGICCFLISMPLVVDPDLGFFANVVVPAGVSVGLLGLDAVSSELENPFGDDANDLDFRGVEQVESDCMRMLELSGDTHARAAFALYQVPYELRDGDVLPRSFVCLRSQFKTDATDLLIGPLPEDAVYAKKTKKAPAASALGGSAQRRELRASGELKTSFLGSFAEGEDDVRQPLLGKKGKRADDRDGSRDRSMHDSFQGFKQMEDFGTETIILEDQQEGVQQRRTISASATMKLMRMQNRQEACTLN